MNKATPIPNLGHGLVLAPHDGGEERGGPASPVDRVAGIDRGRQGMSTVQKAVPKRCILILPPGTVYFLLSFL